MHFIIYFHHQTSNPPPSPYPLPTDHEMEQFEDDPLEFIRLDLSLPGSSTGLSADITTRRQAAADVLQALVGSGYESEATEIVGGWIGRGLERYNASRGAGGDGEAWKAKDSAVYLLTAVATRGSTTQVSPPTPCASSGRIYVYWRDTDVDLVAWSNEHKHARRCRRVLH